MPLSALVSGRILHNAGGGGGEGKDARVSGRCKTGGCSQAFSMIAHNAHSWRLCEYRMFDDKSSVEFNASL